MASKLYELTSSDSKHLTNIATNRAKSFQEEQKEALKEVLYSISAKEESSKIYATITYHSGINLEGNRVFFPSPSKDIFERVCDVRNGYIWRPHFLVGD